MPSTYYTRSAPPPSPEAALDSFSDLDRDFEATSTIGRSSSPPYLSDDEETLRQHRIQQRVNVTQLAGPLQSDSDDDETGERMSPTEKTLTILKLMRKKCPRFSLRSFILELFTSDNGDLKAAVGNFVRDGGVFQLMEVFWELSTHWQRGKFDPRMASWVVSHAAEVVDQEFSWLTNRASEGPHYAAADSLRVSAENTSVDLHILRAAIGKEDDEVENGEDVIAGDQEGTGITGRSPKNARTIATSIALNMRSRNTNYHAVVNALVMWEQRVPKRLCEAFNHYCISASYPFISRAIEAVSQDSTRLAQAAATDPAKLIMLPYDNFNWRERAWETSAAHGTVQHDQVSAMLVSLWIPENLRDVPAVHLADVARFDALTGRRHTVPSEEALESILPTDIDDNLFYDSVALHVATVLASDLPCFRRFARLLPKFTDPSAITPHKTDRTYLPTFDHEQGSTKGNMVVLSHYFLDVLKIPKESFQSRMVFVLGDRLTTARDRAAQDQRAIDRSSMRADHFSSIALTGGLMHYCLNMVRNIGVNHWGGAAKNGDAVSLMVLRDVLPNRSEINTRKVDFYAWLRFLDVILRALVTTAALACLGCDTPSEAAYKTDEMSIEAFRSLCAEITKRHIFSPVRAHPSTERTLSNNATLLLYHLMTLREMRHAIKYGHPTRIHRILKYWMPMFYAGGSYNYSNECMEMLHNLCSDWPEDSAHVLLASMLVNTTGNADGFKECDLDVEHLNNNIKARAHGANASPDLLKNITPAIGELKGLTDQLYRDLGVEAVYQRHHHVQQTKDFAILLEHFNSHHIFRPDAATTKHTPVDLWRRGLQRVAVKGGGHAKHLARHRLRLRTRHGNELDGGSAGFGEDDSGWNEGADEEQEDEFDLMNSELDLDALGLELF